MSPDSGVQVIVVPKPAGKPNKGRRINTLLQYQVQRFREIEQKHLPAHQTGLAVDPSKMTEGEAAEYIGRMTAKLHELGAKPKRTSSRSKTRNLSTEEEVGEALRTLRKRGAAETCSRCAKNDWNAELLGYWASPLDSAGTPKEVGPYIPVLSLTCKNCGALHLHNLKELGVKV